MAAVDIVARLKLAGDEFTREFGKRMNAVEAEARTSSSRINAAFSGIKSFGTGLIAGGAISSMVAAGRQALQYADDLSAVADQSNINVERLQTMKEAFRTLEVEGDKFDNGMRRLNDTLGDVQNRVENGATKALDRMGISQRILTGEIKTTDQLLDAIAAAATRYGDSNRFVSDTVEILGRKLGVDFATALRDGGKELHSLEAQIRSTGTVLTEEMIEKLADANESIDRFTGQTSRLFTIWAAEAIDSWGQVYNAVDRTINRMMVWGAMNNPFTTQAQKLGQALPLMSLPDQMSAARKVVEDARAARDAVPKYVQGQVGARYDTSPMRTLGGAINPEWASHQRAVERLEGAYNRLGKAALAAGLAPIDSRLSPGGSEIATAARIDKPKKAGKSEAEREAEQLRKEAERTLESLEKQTAESETQLRLGDMRARGLDREAEIEEAVARVRERHSDIAGKSIEQVAEHYRISLDQAKTMKDQLALAEQLAIAEVNQRNAAEDKAAAEARDLTLAREQSARAKDREQALQRSIEEREAMERESIASIADFYEDAFRSGGDSIWEDFKDMGLRAVAEIAAQWTLALISGQKVSLPGILSQINAGGASGGLLGGGAGLLGALGGLLGGKSGGGIDAAAAIAEGARLGTGHAMATVLGGTSVAGGAASAGASGLLGAASAAAPYLAIAAAVLPIVGGLFSGTKRGSATVGVNQYGEVGVTSSRGNSKSNIASASGGVGSVGDALARIAEIVGGDINGFSSFSLGVRDGNWRLDPSGRGITKTKNGAIDFGKDEEAAIRAAVSLALERGAVDGISDAARKILASGRNLEDAIAKAASIEELPKLLKARMDPLGAALDAIDEKYRTLIATLEEGGATAEQFADAQKLYKLETDEAIASTREAAASLKEFLAGLGSGPGSPYSLRQQEEIARKALDPFLASIASGSSIDQDKYQQAAAAFLDIERQLYGSTARYFEAMDMIQAATGKAIATIDNAKPIRTASDPFAERTASSTQATAEILSQHTLLLTKIVDKLGNQGVAGGGGFVGASLGFAA